MTLVVTELYDNEFQVSGTDSTGKDGSVVLESESWATYLYLERHKQATEEFNAVAKEELDTIFARILEAAEKAKATLGSSEDYATVTVTEGVEGVKAKQIPLDRNGRLLNMLAQGKHDQLRWAGDRLVAAK